MQIERITFDKKHWGNIDPNDDKFFELTPAFEKELMTVEKTDHKSKYNRFIKDNNAFLPVLGYILGSLFVIVILVAYASYILSPITTPIINATNGTDHQAISQTAVSRGYGGITLAGVALSIVLVIGFAIYLFTYRSSYE